MANKYLLVSEPTTGNFIYYTANSSGELVSIGSTMDFAQGFTDTELALLDNSDYKVLESGQFIVQSDSSSLEVDITPVNYATVETTETTAINLNGYSGINKITINATGGNYAISLDNKATWLTKYDGTWQTITKDEVPTKGMTVATINALVNSDYVNIFQRTQLDLYGYLSNGATFTSFNVSLPVNAAPVISNITITPTNTHEEDVIFACKIEDKEGDASTYKIYFNGTVYVDTIAVPVDNNISVTFPGTLFVMGSNAIKISATDSRNITSEYTIYVTRYNTTPKITGVLAGNYYTATIGDQDNDTVQYRVLFNSAEKVPWTALSQAPLSMNYEINRSEINYNVVNTLRVEFKDEYGASSFVEEQFVGSYYGLMFTDVNGMYYSTDLGVILKKLDFGTLGASQTTVSKEVKLTNKYKSDLKNIILSTTQMANNIYIELSEIESPFSPTTSLNLGTMLIGETRSFFVRVRTDKTSYGSGDFNITVVGDPLLI